VSDDAKNDFDIREPKQQGHEIVGNTKSKGTAE